MQGEGSARGKFQKEKSFPPASFQGKQGQSPVNGRAHCRRRENHSTEGYHPRAGGLDDGKSGGVHISVHVCARGKGVWLVAASKVHISSLSREEGGVERGWPSEMAVSCGLVRHFSIPRHTPSLPFLNPFCPFAQYRASTVGRPRAGAVEAETIKIGLSPLSAGTGGLNGRGRREGKA